MGIQNLNIEDSAMLQKKYKEEEKIVRNCKINLNGNHVDVFVGDKTLVFSRNDIKTLLQKLYTE